jgi:Tol biopolymer transport system component
MKAVCQALVVAALAIGPLLSQTVEEHGGNIYFTGKNGHTVQLTSSGLDSSPSLSRDNHFVVFLREKYAIRIVLSRGEVWDKFLLVGDTSHKMPPRRVLVGNDGWGRFRHPQFSPDGRRICFEARSWATDYSMWVLELATHKVSHSETGDCR